MFGRTDLMDSGLTSPSAENPTAGEDMAKKLDWYYDRKG
jgi:hypothetical protein